MTGRSPKSSIRSGSVDESAGSSIVASDLKNGGHHANVGQYL
ncbi:hypothetical protein FG05_35135 [Fusarium graminearum]|nr:hypothetical protein FG05_35135 [Fusarium graminearum]